MGRQLFQDGPYIDAPVANLGTLSSTSIEDIWAGITWTPIYANDAKAGKIYCVRAGGTISLTARRLDGEIELSVKDTGVGFRPADGARLFEKFTRLHPGGGSSYFGTGLGLYIARELADANGAALELLPKGPGANFRITLKRAG